MKIKAFMVPHRELAQQLHQYEDGQLDIDEILDLFSVLIQNGMAWTLQGSYGRMARHLIDSGSLTSDGTITHEHLPF
jgi:hypothetical protein